ncbi:MAG TPA: xanthine dehydrogenase family protein molybdopterin-binding subunit [Alphaproteobacteria bacterium]|nr:xanthine dehydrogenase family protein molybdopterin-binding subunit [Alphaproteobacteria bacterium]
MLDSPRSIQDKTAWTGRSLLRTEDARLLTGRGRFIEDIRLPDCLHVAFVRSTHARARMTSLNVTPALAVRGVVAVFTGADIRELGEPAVNLLVPEMRAVPFRALALDAVHAVGQPLAAVLAESPEVAIAAAELVEVEYVPIDPGITGDGEPAAALSQQWCCGDVEQAFRNAAKVVRASIQYARVAAMPLEPRHALAAWDRDAEHLTAWLPTQTPHRAREDIAHILGLDIHSVRVVAPDVGGAFGAKASIYPEDVVVAWAARRLGRPVLWRGSRGEDLLAGTHGRGACLEGELALAEDGTMLGLRADLNFPLGHWMTYSAAVPGRNAARILPGPYRVPSVEIRLQASLDNTAAVGIYRGAGRPEAAMLMERLVDEAAAVLACDPLELRRLNLLPVDSFPYVTPTGETLDSGDYQRLLDCLSAFSSYRELRTELMKRRAAGEIVGVGIAFYLEPCGQGWEAARVRLAPDGTFIIGTASAAQGQGRETTFAQLAADVLGVRPERISVAHGDTTVTDSGVGSLASRSTAIGGSAVVKAAEELRRKATVVAGRLLQAAPDDVVLSEEGFMLRDHPERRLDWRAIAEVVHLEHSIGESKKGIESSAVFHAEGEAWSSGACVAFVAIDSETGTPIIERIFCVDDAGVLVNPMLAQAQLMGGLAQGIGEALMERVVYDEHGQLLTGSLMDYALPRARDIPPIHLASCHTPSPTNPLGAKGVGEAGCIGAPAAIANAIIDAVAPLGGRQLDMPLTGERIWRALADARAKAKETEG